CYIDIEEENEKGNDDSREYSQWNFLPDIILEKVFGYLTVKERYYASMVCKNWYFGFHMPPVWSNFIVDDCTLTRPKYNYYSGWHHVLDHNRTQNCLMRVGRYIKGLDFRPEHSFQNLFQFMTLFAWCMDKAQSQNCPLELAGIGAKVKSLKYTFPCSMSQTEDPQGIKLFGTGGQLLQVLKNLLSKFRNLKILKLVDLVLDYYEANHLLDEVLDSCCTVLIYLNLVNITIIHCPILHIGLFLNLKVLVISPQNIDDDVLQLIADTKLKHLFLYQNRYTPMSTSIRNCSEKAWKIIKRDNPELKVHIKVESFQSNEFVFQPEAPVYSILYNSPNTQINAQALIRTIDNYKKTLCVYGHELLPQFKSSQHFEDRVDSLLLLLVRECCFMNTLVIREAISSSTVLLLAHQSKNLKIFHVRRSATILKCEWSQNPEWSDGFYEWLKAVSKSYETVEEEISQIFSRQWKFLSDEQYEKLEVDVRQYT
ncbi:F-box/LRR-repeat protein 3, partial [Condylostylus longicornis]|uniref:F-box/LRR-repeat protein 3 n=1 Tax=Condylostylus longicornis TaxID=2530218 RepID=UPI00244E388D